MPRDLNKILKKYVEDVRMRFIIRSEKRGWICVRLELEEVGGMSREELDAELTMSIYQKSENILTDIQNIIETSGGRLIMR